MNTNLTKTESIIAEFIMKDIQTACFLTATDISGKLNVSDSSVIRLARKLGFSGFMEMQKYLQTALTETIKKSEENIVAHAEELVNKSASIDSSDTINNCFSLAVDKFKNALLKNDVEKFRLAAKLIIESDKKVVTGFRGCRGIADWTALTLSHMLPKVIANLHAEFSAVETLLDLTSKDCLILFSFHRYAKMSETVSKIAKEQGLKTIVITDKITAPPATGADIVFIVNVDSLSFFNSHIAPFFIAEAILSEISVQVLDINKKRWHRLDQYIQDTNLF